MNDPLVTALRRLIDGTEGGRAAVARAIHANEQTLYQIVAGVPLPSGRARGVGRDLRDRLTRAFPNWLMTGADQAATHSAHEPRPPYGAELGEKTVAQPMSPRPFETPPTITWEGLMQSNELPAVFVLAMPDDSMSPRIERGTELIFSTTDTPTPGKGVLVRDKDGQLYVRRYRQTRGSHWQAQAVNEADFEALDSERDGLQVLATLRGVMSGRI